MDQDNVSCVSATLGRARAGDVQVNALETGQFEILITPARFPVGQLNGVALGQMARMKRPWIKVVFTIAAENLEYTEGIGEAVIAPIDIPELLATVATLASN